MSPLDSGLLTYDAYLSDLGDTLVAIENDEIYWAGGWISKGSVSAAEDELRGCKNFA